jgi:hypothetical protein
LLMRMMEVRVLPPEFHSMTRSTSGSAAAF